MCYLAASLIIARLSHVRESKPDVTPQLLDLSAVFLALREAVLFYNVL